MTEASYGTGRRKTATARVFLRPGSGEMTVNGMGMDDYFSSEVLKMIVRQPLQVAEKEGDVDISCTVRGGGSSGQAGAIRHGLSRALVDFDPELREPLKAAGFMTRDPRRKERKKYGQKGARARFQFSKR
ncbi:MAG: 30S ribosomal protein S9 [Acidobacteria bacterium]|nr:30S ribosomal protein S9 [Acidobacteriota bacterium]MCY3965906.1 30S ribosomal protein S9 [Acidobacteriota bacterium]